MKTQQTNGFFDSASLPATEHRTSLGVSFLLHVVLLILATALPMYQLETLRPPEETFSRRSVSLLTIFQPPLPTVPEAEPQPSESASTPTLPEPVSPDRFQVPELNAEPPAVEPIPVAAPEIFAVEPASPAPFVIDTPALGELKPLVRTGLLGEPQVRAKGAVPEKLPVRPGRFSAAEVGEAPTPSAPASERAAGFQTAALTKIKLPANRPRVSGSNFTQVEVAREPANGSQALAVQEGRFGEIVVGRASGSVQGPQAQTDLDEAVQILGKPRPAYTPEARLRRIEGEVLLEVLFKASGVVQILRLLTGLGHGLDVNAIEAARQIRFTPAQRDGRPVDSRATLTIVFQLAY